MPVPEADDGEAPVETVRKHDSVRAGRPGRRKGERARWGIGAIVLVGIGVLIYALLPSVGGLRQLLPVLRDIRFGWVVAAVAFQGLMYVCVAGILDAAVRAAHDAAAVNAAPPAGESRRGVAMIGIGAAFLWTNRAFPGPAVAGLATLTFLLGRRGVSAATAQAAAATFYLADYVGFASISLVLLSTLAFRGKLVGLHPVVLQIALAGVLLAMTATIVLLRSPVRVAALAELVAGRGAAWLRRPDPPAVAQWARGIVEGFYVRWRSISAHPTALIQACCCATIMHLAEIGSVFCAVLAFTAPTTAGQAAEFTVASATGFVAGNLAAIVSFLPAGIGFFETAMGASLHLLGGLTTPQAALATILYRFLSVWLPVPFVLRTARHAVATVARSLRGGEPAPTTEAEI